MSVTFRLSRETEVRQVALKLRTDRCGDQGIAEFAAETLMINAILLAIAVGPKIALVKLAAACHLISVASWDGADSCLEHGNRFIRNTNCLMPATKDLPTGG